jgi:hypothetical protein
MPRSHGPGALLAAAVVTAVAAATVGGATGCGRDDDRGDVPPHAWAAQVCQTLATWRSEIGALTEQARQRMSAATTAAQAKDGLAALLGGAEAASEQARSRVAAAGVPDAANGRRVVDEFAASLARVRDAYASAKTTVAGLDTADAKRFYDAVGAAFARLNQEYAAGAPDTSRVDSPELATAFAQAPACR